MRVINRVRERHHHAERHLLIDREPWRLGPDLVRQVKPPLPSVVALTADDAAPEAAADRVDGNVQPTCSRRDAHLCHHPVRYAGASIAAYAVLGKLFFAGY